MNKKIIAIVTELVPLISAITTYSLIVAGPNTALVRGIIDVTMLFAFLGFVFCIIGRKLAKEDRLVRVLGVLDCITPLLVIGFYVVVIFVFGL
ncbi:MAG: hypothetical protein K6G76_01195 [Lachnospiraceae bacterium]|nr:hypothetical protein [Lachnospiraceae bacterium]